MILYVYFKTRVGRYILLNNNFSLVSFIVFRWPYFEKVSGLGSNVSIF